MPLPILLLIPSLVLLVIVIFLALKLGKHGRNFVAQGVDNYNKLLESSATKLKATWIPGSTAPHPIVVTIPSFGSLVLTDSATRAQITWSVTTNMDDDYWLVLHAKIGSKKPLVHRRVKLIKKTGDKDMDVTKLVPSAAREEVRAWSPSMREAFLAIARDSSTLAIESASIELTPRAKRVSRWFAPTNFAQPQNPQMIEALVQNVQRFLKAASLLPLSSPPDRENDGS